MAALVAGACGEVTIAPAGIRLDLRGKVRAALTGLPIGGARVTLYAPSDTAAAIDSTATIADGSGNYRVVHRLADRADCARIRLQAAAAGYVTAAVPADSIYCMAAAQIVNIEMTPAAISLVHPSRCIIGSHFIGDLCEPPLRYARARPALRGARARPTATAGRGTATRDRRRGSGLRAPGRHALRRAQGPGQAVGLHGQDRRARVLLPREDPWLNDPNACVP
jgi:hypothetical protein